MIVIRGSFALWPRKSRLDRSVSNLSPNPRSGPLSPKPLLVGRSSDQGPRSPKPLVVLRETLTDAGPAGVPLLHFVQLLDGMSRFVCVHRSFERCSVTCLTVANNQAVASRSPTVASRQRALPAAHRRRAHRCSDQLPSTRYSLLTTRYLAPTNVRQGPFPHLGTRPAVSKGTRYLIPSGAHRTPTPMENGNA